MEKQTVGTVISASRQWWLKVNTKPVRMHTMDGATFPYIIKVKYTADGIDFIKRKWINAGDDVPPVGTVVKVFYREDRPQKARIRI